MLIQSRPGHIILLPALPGQWSDGRYSGLRARGGYIIDVEWKDGLVTSLTVTSLAGNPTTITAPGISHPIRVTIPAGESQKYI